MALATTITIYPNQGMGKPSVGSYESLAFTSELVNYGTSGVGQKWVEWESTSPTGKVTTYTTVSVRSVQSLKEYDDDQSDWFAIQVGV